MLNLSKEEIERILYWYEVAFDEGLAGDSKDDDIVDKLEEEKRKI